MEKITVKNLTFAYPNQTSRALDNISLTINDGEFVVVCGMSGSGKSTLLRKLKPIIAPKGETRGEILFDGMDINKMSNTEQAQKIGFVLQNPESQMVCDDVWHELTFALENFGINQTIAKSKIAEIATYFGIQNLMDSKTYTLSGGQKQLVNLASVMITDPKILILDEPTCMLDPISSKEFLNHLKEINTEFGTTVILSEHRLEEVVPIADRIIVLENGKVIANDKPFEVCKILFEGKNPMFESMPTPMKVFFETDSKGKCPITVKEGRSWLSKLGIITDFVNQELNSTNSQTILECKNIWFRYEKNSDDILKGLTFKVNKGEFYGIVGGNGAGKTTALSVIFGLEKQYRGKVKCRCKIAMLPQYPEILFTKKTVLECLKSVSENVDEIIDFCEIRHLLARHPYDLSGGEQQRLALGITLLGKPDILLLDEPTKGLEGKFKVKLANMINELCKSGVTVIAVSHDIEFCCKYAHRCGMFFDGGIVAEGTPKEVFTSSSFYTTSAHKLTKGIISNVVLDTELIKEIKEHKKNEK